MGRATKSQEKAYAKLRSRTAPRPPVVRNLVAAFVVGGLICAAGEGIVKFFMARGLSVDQAAIPTAAVLVALGSFLTGIGVYDELVRFGGMGAALPITGFANSIVAPAMEFKREGWVMGVGARMFQVAGPVLVYGVLASFFVGLAWYLFAGGPR